MNIEQLINYYDNQQVPAGYLAVWIMCVFAMALLVVIYQQGKLIAKHKKLTFLAENRAMLLTAALIKHNLFSELQHVIEQGGDNAKYK